MQHGSDHAHGGGKSGEEAGHAHGGGKAGGGGHKHDMVIVQRDKPENRERSQKILQAVMESFGDVDRSRLKPNRPGGTHYRLTAEMRKEFRRKHPDLPVPGSLVYAKGSNKPIGMVFNGNENRNLDLGMGTGHRHKAGGLLMQHMWFAPQDLDAAFTDQGDRGRKAALARLRGT